MKKVRHFDREMLITWKVFHCERHCLAPSPLCGEIEYRGSGVFSINPSSSKRQKSSGRHSWLTVYRTTLNLAGTAAPLPALIPVVFC